ncbi:unnamed protein product [Thlaspi arvense]|uniref:Uncharacterized protein n=1 Tax=Thlaspi arvense TaxID=13288 RepID=A0AAU9SQS8_THLAR|nr:unnamed protein product [Thlaspi arvense]
MDLMENPSALEGSLEPVSSHAGDISPVLASCSGDNTIQIWEESSLAHGPARFVVASTLFCCGGYTYKTRVESVCGMSLLSGLLETVSGSGQRYSRIEDINNVFANEVSWDRSSASFTQSSKAE